MLGFLSSLISLIKKPFCSKSNTLYVGNLNYSIGSADLNRAFAKFGVIENARVIRDNRSKRSKGYGFVTFENYQDAKQALSLEGYLFKGRNLRVRFANSEPYQK